MFAVFVVALKVTDHCQAGRFVLRNL